MARTFAGGSADSGAFQRPALKISLASSIREMAPGEIGVSGNVVSFGGVVFATFTGGTNGSTPLVIALNSNATTAAVQALVRNITFATTSTSTITRTIRFAVTDGNGGSNIATKPISFTTSVPSGLTITQTATTLNEGQALTINGSFVNSSGLDAHTVEIDWGDGRNLETKQLAAGITTFEFTSHIYSDDSSPVSQSPIKNIRVTVRDGKGTELTSTSQVTVVNVPPVLPW